MRGSPEHETAEAVAPAPAPERPRADAATAAAPALGARVAGPARRPAPAEVLRLQRSLGNSAVRRLLSRQVTVTRETPTPVRANEAAGPGGPYFPPTYIVNGKFAVFTPEAWLFSYRKDPSELTDIKVHVFFGAGGVQGNDFNDVLLHGLRAASNNTQWITIAVPGTVINGANVATPFSDSDITACLSAIGVTNPVTSLRLSGHSRGAISLVHYVGKMKISKSVIDRVTVLDEFQVGDPKLGNYSGKVEQMVAAGVPPAKIRGYETQNPAKVHVKGVQYITLSARCMAVLGTVRMIEDAMALDPAVAAKAAATNTSPDPSNPKQMRTVKDEVDAMTLPARQSLPSTAPPGTSSLQSWCADPATQKAIAAVSLGKLLAFVSSQNLTHYPGQNWGPFAAHEFFVNEIAEELYD